MIQSRYLAALLILLTHCTVAYSQSDESIGIMGQAKNQSRLLAARHEFLANNMRGALTIYREILATEPDNASALYGTAECHYNLKKYNLALEYLDKAVKKNAKVSKETHFFYGQIYHRTAKLDQAIQSFELYKTLVKPGSYEFSMAVKHIKECEFAKEMMAIPSDVTISNLGDAINTRFDDYAPAITADGKKLVFTSRRSDTQGGSIDTKGDYKFFEDIYSSEWDEDAQNWLMAQGVEGELNTETYDAVLSIYPDGSAMFVYKNTVNTTGDIYFSKFNETDKIWKAAEKMPRPINTSYFEGSVSITADGNTLYFISERPEGQGQGDIYVSTRKGGNWSNPKNLGKVLNTDLDEKFVFVHPNGRTLYFSSNGHLTMGSYDIFKSEFVNGEWSVPVNLGYPINTVNEESTFSLTSDNQTLYIAAEYNDSYGERDIYKIDVSRYPLISAGYERSTFGQILCIVTDQQNRPVKGADITVFGPNSKNPITTVQTDKLGRAKVNLPGDIKYKVEIRIDEMFHSQDVQLTLKKEGETVEKVEVKF